MPEPLATRVARELDQLGLAAGTWLVAVSGGPDSVALLHLLVPLAPSRGLDLVVAHADHGLHLASAPVAARVAAMAGALGLPFAGGRLDLPPAATETEARLARYRWLRWEAARRGARGIVTAHHLDDQAETVLMRALRGSGPAGLAGMRRRHGDVVRPLLPFRREELAQYVREIGADAWLDPANEDVRHLRSWLRHDVMPILRARLPDLDERLAGVAAHARRDVEAWDRVPELLGLSPRTEGGRVSVLVAPLGTCGEGVAEQLLRAVARRQGRSLTRAAVRRALGLLTGHESGRRVDLGEGWVAELAFDRLVLGPLEEPAPELMLEGEGEVIWGGWRLAWRREPAGRLQRGGWTTWMTPGPLGLGGPRAGERMRPLGGTGRRLVVRLLQDEAVPRGSRAGWPVVRRGDRVLWVAGVARGDDEAPREGEEAIRLDVHPA